MILMILFTLFYTFFGFYEAKMKRCSLLFITTFTVCFCVVFFSERKDINMNTMVICKYNATANASL